jgi:ArsR family transcriptional regulator
MDIKMYANLFKAIGDETRLFILKELISHEELCACKLLDKVNCNQSTLSHHMKILVDSGLVIARKDWKWVHYSVDRKKLDLLINSLKKE